jgi:serine/threonine protein kinase
MTLTPIMNPSNLDDCNSIMLTETMKRSNDEMIYVNPSSSSLTSTKFRADNLSLLNAFPSSQITPTDNKTSPVSPCSKTPAGPFRLLGKGSFQPTFPSPKHDHHQDETSRFADAASVVSAGSSSMQQEGPGEPSQYVIKFPARSSGAASCSYELDPKNRTMMAKELHLLCILRHEHIVQVHHLSSAPSLCEHPFVVLARLAAETLEDRIAPQSMWRSSRLRGNCDNDLRSRLGVVQSLASVMGYLHEKRIIYRGLEPALIGFDTSNKLKLFSFASARELPTTSMGPSCGGHGAYQLTAMVGAPNYMAPENYLGEPYGPCADVYSFSIVAWEILSQKRAFVSSTTTTNSASATQEQPQQKLPEMSKTWPLLIRNILRFGWARRNATRPSMKVVVAALDQYLDGKAPSSPAIAQYINVMLLSNICFME